MYIYVQVLHLLDGHSQVSPLFLSILSISSPSSLVYFGLKFTLLGTNSITPAYFQVQIFFFSQIVLHSSQIPDINNLKREEMMFTCFRVGHCGGQLSIYEDFQDFPSSFAEDL